MTTRNVLVLNQNFEPITVCRTRRALILLFMHRAELLESYEGCMMHSVRTAVPLPSVLRLNHYVRVVRKEIPLSKRNVLRRDNHRCQYCGRTGTNLTTDHVIPRTLGGTDSWENLVCACTDCNSRKGGQLMHHSGMKLARKPKKPSYFSFVLSALGEVPVYWRKYLFQTG
jgi:5-methylcytosine-specific restriction endonuclease McrA